MLVGAGARNAAASERTGVDGRMDEARLRDILRVLCRIPIERGQLVLYKLAVEAGSAGVTSTAMRKVLGFDQASHRGMMAALTVRINNTPRETSPTNKPGLRLLFDTTWNGRENTYKARPELLEAIARLAPLNALMQRPTEEVLTAPTLPLSLPQGIDAHPPAPPPPTPLAPPPPPPPAAAAFEALLDAMEAAKLVYPSELVANLLLALQVKRFVILTGISGTGKTRIAQVLAQHFSARKRVEAPEEPGDQGALVTVMPYMRKYHRMILPQSLAAQVPTLPTEQGSGTLKATWPGGSIDLSVYVRDAVQVMFRGPMRTWFDTTFSEGDTFLARLTGPANSPPDTIVLSVPKRATVREERVANSVVMAVRPDWTDHRGLLGSYNPLTKQYLVTPFLRLLLQARDAYARAPDKQRASPYFLVLDEMNLARVEHYFADFLSSLESGEPIHLHDNPDIEVGLAIIEEQGLPVPRQLAVPPNVFFIGTVNVDESTYMFSPKVLDRAFTIELNSVDLDSHASGADRGGDLVLTRWNGRLDPPTGASRDDWQWLNQTEDGELAAEVRAIHALLSTHNRHFGYRVADELARFVRIAVEQSDDGGAASWVALDLGLLQKVLVKLHGTRHELAKILDELLRFALVGVAGDQTLSDPALWTYVAKEAVLRRKDESAEMDALFPRSAAKLWRMRRRLEDTGFTSWIE